MASAIGMGCGLRDHRSRARDDRAFSGFAPSRAVAAFNGYEREIERSVRISRQQKQGFLNLFSGFPDGWRIDRGPMIVASPLERTRGVSMIADLAEYRNAVAHIDEMETRATAKRA